MIKRLEMAFAALLMHLVFGLSFALSWIATFPILLIWIISGNEVIKDWIYSFGKAEDQAMNASMFGGDPKETVSSHAGRWIQKRISDDIVVPRWVRLVKWFTDIFSMEHVLNSIEQPFEDLPL